MAVNPKSGDNPIAEPVRSRRSRAWERYLDAALGLRNHWYPALFSRELPEGGTNTATIGGERLFFKRVDGKVYCVEDRCIHRGVPLSARPECYTKDTLTCWFHGFTYNWDDGRLVQIITEAEEDQKQEVGSVGLKAYPTHEFMETIFVWIGDEEPVEPRLDLQPRLYDEHMVVEPLARHLIHCDWRVASENGFDPSHIYGHRNWVAFDVADEAPPVPLSTYPSSPDVVRTIEDPDGPKGVVKLDDVLVYAARIGDQEVRAKRYPPDAPAVVRGQDMGIEVSCFLPCGLQVVNFPFPGMVHFEWYVPVDDEHHMYTILQGGYAKTEAEREAFKKDSRERVGPLVWREPGEQPEGFNNFDAFGREQCHQAYSHENWWEREYLFTPDYIIMEWRKLVAKHARGIQQWGDWQPVRD